MMCFTVALQLIGSGPMFQNDILRPFVDPCYDNWWAHILYVINWVDLRQMVILILKIIICKKNLKLF